MRLEPIFIQTLSSCLDPRDCPFFLCELAVNSNNLHKDLKKLAVQMAGVMFHLIERIQRSKEREMIAFLPNLRVFGALVSGSSIEFVISRILFNKNEKIMII